MGINHIILASEISPNLALRDAADFLFKKINSTYESDVTIDFVGIRAISRSFAHQYILRKKETGKRITETNVPSYVRDMLKIVERPSPPKLAIKNLDQIQVVSNCR